MSSVLPENTWFRFDDWQLNNWLVLCLIFLLLLLSKCFLYLRFLNLILSIFLVLHFRFLTYFIIIIIFINFWNNPIFRTSLLHMPIIRRSVVIQLPTKTTRQVLILSTNIIHLLVHSFVYFCDFEVLVFQINLLINN